MSCATIPAMLIEIPVSQRDRARGLIYHWHRADAPLLRRQECRRCGSKLEPHMRHGVKQKDLCSDCSPLDLSMKHTHV